MVFRFRSYPTINPTCRHMFTPSTLPEGSYAVATCQVCGGHRYPSRALMLEKTGDLPLNQIAGRLRCIEPGCGNIGMSVELRRVEAKDTEAKGGWPTLPGLPR